MKTSGGKRIRVGVGRRGQGGGKRKREEKGKCYIPDRIVTWVKNKDEDFWVGLRSWDVVVLLETWTYNKKRSEIRES